MLQELHGPPIRAGCLIGDFLEAPRLPLSNTQAELNSSYAKIVQTNSVGIRFSHRSTSWLDFACRWKCGVSTAGLHVTHLLTSESVCIIAVDHTNFVPFISIFAFLAHKMRKASPEKER